MADDKPYTSQELAMAALTFNLSLMRTLVEKGLLTAEEANAVSDRAAVSVQHFPEVGRAADVIRRMLRVR